jgi:hypothetical protein
MVKRREKRAGGSERTTAPVAPPQRAKGVAAGGWRALLLGQAAGLVMSPFLGVMAGFLLLFGGVFLAVAWQVGAQPLIDHVHYAPFTARASGRVVESWAALEFDPDALPKDKLYWQPYAKIATCEVVEFSGDWGAAQRRAFCGNRFDFGDHFALHDWRTLAPGIPFTFARDAAGFAVAQVRLSKPALDWLSSHPPYDTFMLPKPPPATALAALRLQFDAPLDVAVASWMHPAEDLPLALDPAHPDDAMPARYVDDRRHGFWYAGPLFALLFAVPGVLVWRLGLRFLFPGQGEAVIWLLTVLPLLALPWWGDVLPRIVRHADRDWGDVVQSMLDDMTRTTRLIASDAQDASLADGQRLVWHVDQGIYADTFGRIRFHAPDAVPATETAALDALRTQAAAQVGDMPSQQRSALFTRLHEQYEAFARGVQAAFTTAAENTVQDPRADPDARRAAKDFLILGSGGSYYQNRLDALERAALERASPERTDTR